MKAAWSAFAVGFIFSLGLGLSGMTLPARVMGFLDILGNWDPTLAFVMGGAVVVYAVGFRFVGRLQKPLCETQFRLPTRRDISKELVIGSAMFGVGWGLAGFCPGPALTSVASGSPKVLLFVFSMFLGMFAHKWVQKRRQQVSQAPAENLGDEENPVCAA